MYDKNNIFAKIIRGEIPSDKIYEDEEILAINDLAPVAPIHVLVIPKGEYISFDDFITDAPQEIIAKFFRKVKEIANDLGVGKSGYRILANHGKDAMQTVPHFHMHILAGKDLGKILP